MSVARQFFTFLCAATITGFSCKPGFQLPPPVKVAYKWMDPFDVNVSWSWKKPDNLSDTCTIKYLVWSQGKVLRTQENFSKDTYFTEVWHSDSWNVSIQAVPDEDKACSDWKDSKPVNITVKTLRPRTELVKDFKCSLESDRTRCSWTPLKRSLKMNVSYRTSKENDNVRACIGSNSHEENVCYLNINKYENVYVSVEAETGLSTFQPKYESPLPDMNITEKGSDLILTIPHPGPAVGTCDLDYNICITQCNKNKTCRLYTTNSQVIPYNKNCQYKIEYSLKTHEGSCIPVTSPSKVIFYGENRSPDETLTVVAIVVPIILSVCVILSCYCFRRHREIICPTMPDPSTIFKEMMMSGNKEPKPTPENLYTPVPEPTEHVTLVTENSVLQQAA